MAYIRKRRGVKGRRKMRKRVYRRGRVGVLAMPRLIRPNKLVTKRTFYLENWSFSTALISGYWRYYSFALNQVPNLVEYQGLFDEYKINAIKVTFRPAYDSVPSDAPALNINTGPQAYAHVSIDPAATNLPSGIYNSSTVNSFLENSGVKTYTANKPFSVYFKPMIRDQVQGTGQNAELRRPRYIRTNEPGATHAGFNIMLQQNNMSANNSRISLDVFVTFYLSLKNMR